MDPNKCQYPICLLPK